jgi:hypothetical protein
MVSMDVAARLGDNVKRQRKLADLSQEELSIRALPAPHRGVADRAWAKALPRGYRGEAGRGDGGRPRKAVRGDRLGSGRRAPWSLYLNSPDRRCLSRYHPLMPTRSSKSRDLNALAAAIVSETTEDQVVEQPDGSDDEKNPHAVALGRLGGMSGGKARAQKLSAERRSEIARQAAQARWARKS